MMALLLRRLWHRRFGHPPVWVYNPATQEPLWEAPSWICRCGLRAQGRDR